MRLAGLLHLAATDKKRFDNLRRHEQLPFHGGPANESARKNWRFTIRDAFALRMTLDLIGGEGDGESKLGGVPPSYAHKVIYNALGYARERYETLGDLVVHRVFLGGVIFKSRHEGDDGRRFSRWFAGPAEELGDWIAETGRESNANPVRVLLVDAGRAALQVIEAARELDINDNAEGEKV